MFFNDSKAPTKRRAVPLLPLRDIIVFPHMVSQLFVGRERSIHALDAAMAQNKEVMLAAQKNAKTNEPTPEDVFLYGTLGTIMQLVRLPDGTVRVLVEGRRRAKIKKFLQSDEYFLVDIEEAEETVEKNVEIEALMRSIQAAFEEYLKLNKSVEPDELRSIQLIDEPSRLADTVIANMPTVKLSDRQDLLENANAKARLEKLHELLRSEVEILLVQKKIRSRVKKQMEKTQKEYYLNEQMQAIQKELGGTERDELKNELAEIEDQLKAKKLSEEAQEKAKKELKKLKLMHPTSAEATVVRNYLDWIAALPWHEKSEENYDLAIAETVLDEDHYGLRKIKERIIEYLAVQALVRKLKGPVLCFCGPPGVGKTSLAKSIARATGRKFARIALGGVRDEAEIRGHRRTYIGAMPGKLVQTLKKVGTDNPVILLDEIDKLASDFRGDPAAALLEVLDPEQNHSFADHYMDLDYDLSDVMFITTANSLSAIPVPLQDRMEIIELSGYTEFEKMNIATKYLLPRQAKECGLDGVDFKVSESALRTIIHHYTSEAGVRNLEREIGSVARKAARKVVESGKETKINVLAKDVPQFLGVPKYRLDKKEEKDQVGLTNGLYVTSVGGGLLSCEASVVPGKGKIVITGRLEKGMEESMQAAMSYIRSRSALLGLADNFHETIDIHVHFPDFVQKDGPSAGVTAATSIASALLKLPVRRDVAMTGEITLRGRVMPIGGVKEKLLGAHRAGITTVFIPAENQHHLFEVPRRVLKAMRIVLVDSADQVLREAIRFPNADAVFGPRPATLEYRNGDLLETSDLPLTPAGAVPPARPSGTAGATEEAVRTTQS